MAGKSGKRTTSAGRRNPHRRGETAVPGVRPFRASELPAKTLSLRCALAWAPHPSPDADRCLRVGPSSPAARRERRRAPDSGWQAPGGTEVATVKLADRTFLRRMATLILPVALVATALFATSVQAGSTATSKAAAAAAAAPFAPDYIEAPYNGLPISHGLGPTYGETVVRGRRGRVRASPISRARRSHSSRTRHSAACSSSSRTRRSPTG